MMINRRNRFRIFLISFVLTFETLVLFAQDVTQVVRGRVTDDSNGTPVAGLTVEFLGGEKVVSATSDDQGNFTMEVATGRYRLRAIGSLYQVNEQEIVVISGHTTNIRISASPISQELKYVEVSSPTIQDSPGNIRSLTIEKTLRVPANFFDPVRVATAYPGVIAASDQANAIIVRGNSPNGLLWRLNGLDMVNPNHLANAGTLSDMPAANGGGVNILSAQMLERTDFYIVAFPATFGNALSGVVDMTMRDGSNSEMQYTAQASLIGLDFAAEGPVGKNNSFVANYRYSTVGLLSAMGVNLGDEAISFQDLSFRWSTDLAKSGKLSLFGIWGSSKNEFDAKDVWVEDKDMYDIDYSSDTYAAGFNFSKPLGKGELFVGALYSSVDQFRQQIPSDEVPPSYNYVVQNKLGSTQAILSSNIKYRLNVSHGTTWDLGVMTNYMENRYDGSRLTGFGYGYTFDDSQSGFLVQPFTQLTAVFKPFFKVDVGARFLQYTFNATNALEPRINVRIIPTRSLEIDLSYSLISQLQNPYLYSLNEELKPTRSHDLGLTVNMALDNDITLRGGIFYQSLFDVPVSDLQGSFSALNQFENFPPVPTLGNHGEGKNYGIDVTLEKLFYARHYFIAGGSYYQSKYTGSDGIERDTRWNGNYTFTATYGKEWTKKTKNRTIGLSSRALFLGGLRESAINIGTSQAIGETVYDNQDPYSEKLQDYFRVDLRLSFRKNKPNYTRTFAIDIQNITNQQNEAYHYYDFTQQKIVTKFQLGIIPVLVYRIDF
jgi:hypothetical protein